MSEKRQRVNLQTEVKTPKNKVTIILFRIGIRLRYKGFYYLRREILLFHEDGTKRIEQLHEEVANEFTTKKNRVEKAILKVINVAWKNNPERVQELVEKGGKPTPSEMVYAIAKKI